MAQTASPSVESQEQYAALPDALTLREIRVLVEQKGFRSREVLVVTTLLDAERYTADALAQLYRRRWQAELNLRSLKTVLQMDHLRCKTPHRVRNEFWMHLTAYNLIRGAMAAAAARAGVEPWTVSFKGTLQTLAKFLPLLETAVSTSAWCDALLEAIAAHVIGNRPDRFEQLAETRDGGQRQIMGVGRLIADADHQEAEFAVMVGDAWQGCGLGSLLTDECLALCQRWGIRRVSAETAPDNLRMLGMFHRRGFTLDRTVAPDVVVATKELAPAAAASG